MRCAVRSALVDDLPHRVLQVHGIALAHRDLRLHLQAGERRAHLVGGIGDEPLLGAQARIEPRQQVVERADERPHFLGHVGLVDRREVARLAPADRLA